MYAPIYERAAVTNGPPSITLNRLARPFCIKCATISLEGVSAQRRLYRQSPLQPRSACGASSGVEPPADSSRRLFPNVPPRVALLAGTSVEQIRLVLDDLRIEGLKLKPPRRRRAENIECLSHGPFVDDLETLTCSRSRRLSKQLHLA